ncbi:unnamed protein product [Caenorhabditis bovis]|uniref:PA domain-containing protein n=1 Tax=Caenorhabditis bovis TaxID=2654633 RepID=A0A8S1FCW5_9PELO|nr:unnamed protein product [Caenorhabditis bovis]
MREALLLYTIWIGYIMGKVPREYEEVDESEMMVFTVKQPNHLAYTYQMKHAYMLGSLFNLPPNTTIRNLELVKAEPYNACRRIVNVANRPLAYLVARGDCSFSQKAENVEEAGGKLMMISDTSLSKPQDFINMLPDSSLKSAGIPCVYISSITGHYFREHLEYYDDPIIMDIPVAKSTSFWLNHQRRAPWELWPEDSWFI